MTTFHFEKKKCVLCSKITEVQVVLSYTRFGYPDLDFHETGMSSCLFHHFIQFCEHCGYSNSDISEFIPECDIVVKTKIYQGILANQSVSNLVKKFICSAIIRLNINEYGYAGWNYLRGAWAAEFELQEEMGRDLRRKAVFCFIEAQKTNNRFAENLETEILLIIELLRRVEYFELALNMCRKLEPEISTDNKPVIELQMKLILEADSSCHNYSEIHSPEENLDW